MPIPQCLEAALSYLNRGWSCIPLCNPEHKGNFPPNHAINCQSPGKAPPWPWKDFQTHLPKPDQLKLLWARNPFCNVGIIMGKVSGLVGIDIDGPDGETALQKLANGHPIPETIEFSTGKGRRLLFAVPNGKTIPITSFQTSTTEPLRILGEGSQTVAPPSKHHSGKTYTWTKAPGQTPIAQAPDWLLVPKKSQGVALPHVTAANGSPITTNRNITLTGIAGSARRAGANAEEIYALLCLTNKRCVPPLPDAELKTIANSVAKYPPATMTGQNKQQITQQPTPIEIVTAKDLIETDYPEPKWAVPGLIPEGATILAGRPKSGKSLLIMGIGIAVATGGKALGTIGLPGGRALYLALEDGKRRLKKRLTKILQGDPVPDRFEFATNWPRASEGGITAISHWIEQHKTDARLIIIDTLARIRDIRQLQTGIYDDDYRSLANIKDLADGYGISLLIIHHTRKQPTEDPLDSVSGTLGLSGAADAILVLRRPRNHYQANLFITGRDLDEANWTIEMDKATFRWKLLNMENSQLTIEQIAIINAIKEFGKPANPMQIATALKKSYAATKQMMWRMSKDDLLSALPDGSYDLTANDPTCPQPGGSGDLSASDPNMPQPPQAEGGSVLPLT